MGFSTKWYFTEVIMDSGESFLGQEMCQLTWCLHSTAWLQTRMAHAILKCVFQAVNTLKHFCSYRVTYDVSLCILPYDGLSLQGRHFWTFTGEQSRSPSLPLSLQFMFASLLTSTYSVATHTRRALSESLEQLENMKEHALFLIDSVISSLITSAGQGKPSDS